MEHTAREVVGIHMIAAFARHLDRCINRQGIERHRPCTGLCRLVRLAWSAQPWWAKGADAEQFYFLLIPIRDRIGDLIEVGLQSLTEMKLYFLTWDNNGKWYQN